MPIVVNHAALQTASTDLTTGGDRIEAALDSMDTELQPLMTQWEGDAQQAYLQYKEQWTEGMMNMRKILLAVSGAVVDASDDFSATDRRNASLFS
ncbi:WXG100 family type VII secretion target [Schaalia sp. 19OD2882]|uniref:WXG100 family type VII secretion target n=1 Tax=Schaalia sp. 19OD2882 TaxID=2794089 RepID=UPI001C1EB701|nr:WXG100 family type VII secretion target [Schaalia sp. 19OD2882]QWW19829.1 WXG100 family type VII secretion target [Schaalia sp. 19OD2882]